MAHKLTYNTDCTLHLQLITPKATGFWYYCLMIIAKYTKTIRITFLAVIWRFLVYLVLNNSIKILKDNF